MDAGEFGQESGGGSRAARNAAGRRSEARSTVTVTATRAVEWHRLPPVFGHPGVENRFRPESQNMILQHQLSKAQTFELRDVKNNFNCAILYIFEHDVLLK